MTVVNKVMIGVTGPDRGGYAAWLMTRMAIWRVGAVAVRITPSRPCDESRLHGFVIGGGSDVEPQHYGEEPQESKPARASKLRPIDWIVNILLFLLRRLFSVKDLQRYDPERDELEKRVIQLALRQGLPVLGICRGSQLLNIVLGGSLYQKIHDFYGEVPFVRSLLPVKSVNIESNSLLSQVMQSNSAVINALHNQAIKEPGTGVTVTARDMANVVQAIEYNEREFVVGVQWHPEYLPQLPHHQALFKQLVMVAAEKAFG